ncbi:MAG TPA: tetratricopeptide repeat protein, partial [Bacteroidia bacterium]|nr:tetratricopeptide repeat protein [Bacteroidia bacterium]
NLLKEFLKLNPNNAAGNYELGNLYRYTGRYDEALKCAKIAALADSKNEWYNILYIECLHNKHLYMEAAARYEVLLKNYPYRPDFYQGLAGEYIYANKPDKAIQAYTRLQKNTGPDDDIALQKVKIFTQLKKWAEAEAELKNLINANPKESRYYTYLADLYQQEGQPQKALDTYKDVLKNDSLNPYVHLATADYYRQQHKEEDFYKELKKAFVSDDLDIDSKIKILMSYYNVTEQAGKLLPQAYELCALLIKQYPDNPKSHSMYADFLYRDKKTKEAIVELKKTLEFDKSKYQIWNQLLVCESEISSFDSLAKHSAEAMDLFPDQAVPYYLNGVAYIRLKQYKKAIQPLKEGKQFVFENTPLEVEFYSNLGDAYNALKEYDKSDKEYENALKLDPNNASILNNYAYYLSLRKENLEKAEKMSKHSLELAPNSISYIDTYGWILYQQQKYEEAKKYLEKAFDRGGFNRPAIVEHYGDVMFKLNDIDKAVENWKKARELGNKSDLLQKKITDKKLYEE